MRRSVQSTFVKVFLFGLLIISFGLWGVSDVFYSAPESQTVASIEDAELDFPTYANQFQATLRQTGLLNAGVEISPATGKFIERAVLDRWALGVALDKEVAKMRLAVTDAELRDEIRRDANFRDAKGNFSRNRFESFLVRQSITEQMYLEQVREAILQNQLIRTLLGGTPIPQAQAKLLTQYSQTFRASQVLEVLATPLMQIAEASEAEISAFYTQNPERFREPEKRTVALLSLSLEDIAADVDLEDGAIEEYFEANRAQFSVPERRSIERILFPDEASAREAWLALENDMDFVMAAQKYANQSLEAVILGEITRENFADRILAERTFGLELNTHSDPFEGLFGWMIAQVRAIKPAEVPDFGSIRATLEAELRQERAADQVFDYVNQVEDLLAGGATLAEITADVPLPQSRLEVVMADNDVHSSELLRAQVASLKAKDDRQIFEDDAGGFRLIELQKLAETLVPPLKEIGERAREAWREDQQRALALQQASLLAERVNQGESLIAIAEVTRLVLRETEPVNRDGRPLSTNAGNTQPLFLPEPAHLGALFALNPGVAVALPSPLGARVMVMIKETVAETSLETQDAALKNQIATETYFGVEEALRARYPLQSNRAALNYLYEFLNGGSTPQNG
ncbi:MAG: SurA N-terminal domain-containing protein [Alphaproteobacteria bacterium]|nr:SurA N-terminal domain-containing protein [Alphaproteobacteria bacterium]